MLVRVAGAGLDPQKHLGKTLAALRPTLFRLHDLYGLDLCGEGGEYETIVLDCPAFKRAAVVTGDGRRLRKRVRLDKTEVVLDAENCGKFEREMM